MTVFTKTFPTGAAFAGNGNAGLTKREYFAAQAMKGILAGGANIAHTREQILSASTAYADGLIAQLNNEPSTEPQCAEPLPAPICPPFTPDPPKTADFIRGENDYSRIEYAEITAEDERNLEYMAGYNSMLPF